MHVFRARARPRVPSAHVPSLGPALPVRPLPSAGEGGGEVRRRVPGPLGRVARRGFVGRLHSLRRGRGRRERLSSWGTAAYALPVGSARLNGDWRDSSFRCGALGAAASDEPWRPPQTAVQARTPPGRRPPPPSPSVRACTHSASTGGRKKSVQLQAAHVPGLAPRSLFALSRLRERVGVRSGGGTQVLSGGVGAPRVCRAPSFVTAREGEAGEALFLGDGRLRAPCWVGTTERRLAGLELLVFAASALRPRTSLGDRRRRRCRLVRPQEETSPSLPLAGGLHSLRLGGRAEDRAFSCRQPTSRASPLRVRGRGHVAPPAYQHLYFRCLLLGYFEGINHSKCVMLSLVRPSWCCRRSKTDPRLQARRGGPLVLRRSLLV